jgi:hypothetical protein
MKVEQEARDPELVRWIPQSDDFESPSGAAAAMALVASVAFTLGLALAAFLFV